MRFYFLLVFACMASCWAQESILWNVAVHTGKGNVLYNATLILEKEKIKQIITDKFDTTGRKVIDLTGQHLYPGIIAPYSTLGLTELESVRGQRDYEEVGEINPNVRTIVAYNTDSDIIPTLVQNGVLMAQIAPRGELMPGQSSVVTLQGNNWEEAAYKTDIGIHLTWPSKYIGYIWWDDLPAKVNEKYEQQVASLKKHIEDAYTYSKTTKPLSVNLKLEAMRGLFDSTKILFVSATFSSQITEAVHLLQKLHVKRIVIVGALDGEEALPLLSEHKIPVIFTRVHSLPAHTQSSITQAYQMPKKLYDSNILYALSYDGDLDAMGARNLPFTAGTTAAYGLSQEQALASITLNTAKILGIDHSCGSIEVGKDATLFVSKGDALDILGSKLTHAYIKGVKQDLSTKQDKLYHKYKK